MDSYPWHFASSEFSPKIGGADAATGGERQVIPGPVHAKVASRQYRHAWREAARGRCPSNRPVIAFVPQSPQGQGAGSYICNKYVTRSRWGRVPIVTL